MADLKRKIATSVRKKRREIEALEEDLQDLERRAAEIRVALEHARPAMRELEGLLEAAQDEESSPKRRPQELRSGSKIYRAREVILAAGRPLHVRQILAAMNEEDSRANRTALGGSLGNYARRGQFFTKTAPNTFGLVEFKRRMNGDSLDDDDDVDRANHDLNHDPDLLVSH